MELKEFKIIILPLRDKLLHYARRLTDDSPDAEDIVQDAFIKLWNMRDKLDDYRSPEAICKTITHNLCMDYWRSRKPDPLSLDQVQMTDNQYKVPDRWLEEKDNYNLMRQIIDSLPPLQRSIIYMKDVQEYESDEIGEITGCNAEAIRSNLSRARKKVRDQYLLVMKERRKEK